MLICIKFLTCLPTYYTIHNAEWRISTSYITIRHTHSESLFTQRLRRGDSLNMEISERASSLTASPLKWKFPSPKVHLPAYKFYNAPCNFRWISYAYHNRRWRALVCLYVCVRYAMHHAWVELFFVSRHPAIVRNYCENIIWAYNVIFR